MASGNVRLVRLGQRFALVGQNWWRGVVSELGSTRGLQWIIDAQKLFEKLCVWGGVVRFPGSKHTTFLSSSEGLVTLPNELRTTRERRTDIEEN